MIDRVLEIDMLETITTAPECRGGTKIVAPSLELEEILVEMESESSPDEIKTQDEGIHEIFLVYFTSEEELRLMIPDAIVKRFGTRVIQKMKKFFVYRV